MMSEPLAYLITFHTYGTWLHGDPRGSVDRQHNVYGTDLVPKNNSMRKAETARLDRGPVKLDAAARQAVRRAILSVVEHRRWMLRALAVRTNHVHLVIEAQEPPERVMNTIKSWATRRLRVERLIHPRRKVWTSHGSTRYLWRGCDVLGACQYVADGQGGALA